ncbi:putative aryl-alcohol dehydrogenase Aad16p [Trichomonascus vanleenenianus]|uniref:aldo/keto reductase n=1 Tax=Trichomonascus vanleenenianus TaxID=2268995 RepID=UPI003ECA5B5A
MEYKCLGSSGLKISRVIAGCMSYGKSSWQEWVLDDEEKIMDLLKKCYDSGIRTFDTADVYSNGESERWLGKFLKKYDIPRSTVIIFSKAFFVADDPKGTIATSSDSNTIYYNRKGLSRKHLMDAIDASTERLGTYIDLYQIHRFDPDTPIEETMCALNDIVKSGKARYIGASSMRAYQFVSMQAVAEKNGWTKFISMQNFYNLIYREEEREMIPYCEETGVGIIPWSPIARGLLARPLDETSQRRETDKFIKSAGIGEGEASKEIISRVEKLAKKKGVSMSQISTAWVLSKGHCPIIGFNKLDRIDEAVAALDINLSDEDVTYLEEAYKPRKIIGHA